jgi:rhodanese-related sulfurtransferase
VALQLATRIRRPMHPRIASAPLTDLLGTMKLARWLGASIVFTVAAYAAEVPKVAPAEAAKLVANGKAILVDVREPNEWAETGVAQPAVLLPKSDFDGEQKQWKEFLSKVGSKQVIVYCRTGRRSGAVAGALAEKGVNVANAGGLKDWTDAGLPTRKVEAPATTPPKP